MKRHVLAALAALVAVPVACTPGQRGDAASVLDVVKTACIIAHQVLPDTDVARVCGIAGPLLGPMRDILTSARTASAPAVAASRTAACAPAKDGGAP